MFALIAERKLNNVLFQYSTEAICDDLEESIRLGKAFWDEFTDKEGKSEFFNVYVMKFQKK